jgi:hypothetical protein
MDWSNYFPQYDPEKDLIPPSVVGARESSGGGDGGDDGDSGDDGTAGSGTDDTDSGGGPGPSGDDGTAGSGADDTDSGMGGPGGPGPSEAGMGEEGIGGFGIQGYEFPVLEPWESPQPPEPTQPVQDLSKELAALNVVTFMEPSLMEQVNAWFTQKGNELGNMPLAEVMSTLAKGLLQIPKVMAVIANPASIIPMTVMSFMGKALGVPTSPIGAIESLGKGVYQSFWGTPEQQATSREATSQEFNRQIAVSLDPKVGWGESGSEASGGFSVESSVLAKQFKDNEKRLDIFFKQAEAVGDYNNAFAAVKSFEATALARTEVEKEIVKYSQASDFDVIEPELRVATDDALQKGMFPKEAVSYAYTQVKKGMVFREFIKDYQTKKKLELAGLSGGNRGAAA